MDVYIIFTLNNWNILQNIIAFNISQVSEPPTWADIIFITSYCCLLKSNLFFQGLTQTYKGFYTHLPQKCCLSFLCIY